MKQPLYALLIAPDEKMRHDAETGKKLITIREGHRDYRKGLCMLCCHLVPWAVMVEITEVRYCTAGEVTEEEYRANGYGSAEEMLADLQKYYPHLSWDSPVTVIRWKNPRGALVDKAKAGRKRRKNE